MFVYSEKKEDITKSHTSQLKSNICELGRQFENEISFGTTVLTGESLNSVTPITNASLLKSVMKELDFECVNEIPVNTVIKYRFGLLVNNEYEYLNFGNFIVYESKYNADTKSYNYICYDKLLYSMKEYTSLKNGTFPMNIRDYLKNLCLDLGLTFKNQDTTFANYDKILESDPYANLGYTYRDIFDELSAVTGGIIGLDSLDLVEVKYPNNTGDEIDESFLKSVNVSFKEKYGPINSIVLSRSAESDNVFLQDEDSIEANGLCELKIIDNQIMNGNNRSDFLPDILEKMSSIEFYINDFQSTGIGYYDVYDYFSVKIEEKSYKCLLFNSEFKVTQGLVEDIYTEKPEETQTDYTKADKTDRKINQTNLTVDKINQQVNALISENANQNEKLTQLELSTDNINASVSEIQNELLLYGEKSGNPAIITNAGNYPLVTQKLVGGSNQQTRSGKNSIILEDANYSSNGVNVSVKNGVITIDGTPSEATSIEIPLKNSINVYWASYYVLSLNNSITHNGTFTIVGDNSLRSTIASFATENSTAIKSRNPNSTYTTTYNKIILNLTANEEYDKFIIKPQFEYTGTTASSAVPTEWEQGGISPSLDYPSEVVNAGMRKNLFKISGKNLKPIEVGDDLSGKTLILSFPDEITGFISTGQSSEFIKVSDTKYLNYFKSSTSGIVEEVSFHNDGEEIFLWSEYNYEVMDNSKEFILPDDFGIVTSIDAECGAYGYVNIEVPESGITYTPNDDGTFNLNGIATADAEFMTSLSLDDSLLKSGVQYEAVTNVDEENIEIAVLGYNDDTQVDEYFLLSAINKKINKIVNISESVNKIVYKIRVLNNAEIDLKNIEVGLYENTSPNLFVPYGKNLIELVTRNSSDDDYEINSCNMILDNVEDGLPALSEEIADYIENDKIYKSVGVLKLKGWSSDENWSVTETNGNYLFSMNLNCIGNIGLSTHLKYDTTGTSTSNNQFRLENNSLVVIAPRLGGTNFTDVVTWKNYLQEQFKNNKPVTIYYPLPETQELTLNYSGNLELFKDYNRVECMDSMITDMYVKYLTNSAITDTYALKSELDMTAGAIRAEVSDEVSGLNASLELKVNREDVVSELNASADVINLQAGKFTMESEGLTVDSENGVEVGGFSMSEDAFHGTSSIIRNYTQEDITRLQGLIQGTIYPTDDDYTKYDLNGDHYFDVQDLLRVQKIVSGSASPTQSVEYNINSNDPVRCVSIKNTDSGDENVNFGLFGGYIRELGFYQLTSKDGENETTILASGIQTPVVNQTSLETKKKNFEPLKDALELIEKTDVYKYHLKGESDDDKKHIGLVIPEKGNFRIADEFVSTTGDSVDTYSIIATCLKAIKELNDEIKILKKELERSGRDK